MMSIKLFPWIFLLCMNNLLGNEQLFFFPSMEKLHKILQQTDGHAPFLPRAMTTPSNGQTFSRSVILDFYQQELLTNHDAPLFMYELYTGKDTAPPSLSNTLITKKFLYKITDYGDSIRGIRLPLRNTDVEFVNNQLQKMNPPQESLLLEKNLITSVVTPRTREMLEEMRTYPRCTYITYWPSEAIANSFVAVAWMPDIENKESVPKDLINWLLIIRYSGKLSQNRFEEARELHMKDKKIAW